MIHLMNFKESYGGSKGPLERRLEDTPWGNLGSPPNLEESASLHLGSPSWWEGRGAKHSPPGSSGDSRIHRAPGSLGSSRPGVHGFSVFRVIHVLKLPVNYMESWVPWILGIPWILGSLGPLRPGGHGRCTCFKIANFQHSRNRLRVTHMHYKCILRCFYDPGTT